MWMENERLLKTTFHWIPNKRRKIGRPRKKWKGQIQKAMQTRGLKNNEWNDKSEWRQGCDKWHIRL
nr:unnamed protein product [Callosobruchus analis]